MTRDALILRARSPVRSSRVVEASPYMQCSKSLGYLAYPLLTFFLVAALSMQAQTTDNPPQSTPPAQSPAPDTEAQPTPLQPTQPTPLTRDPLSQAQQQQGNSSSQPQTNYPNEQDRVRLAREAQERVRARRAGANAGDHQRHLQPQVRNLLRLRLPADAARATTCSTPTSRLECRLTR